MGSTRPLRGLFMGSGAGIAEPGMAELVVELTGASAAQLELLYLGTATYDAAEPRGWGFCRACSALTTTQPSATACGAHRTSRS